MGLKERLKAHKVKILTLDIECSPNIAHVWGLFQQNVSLSQLRETATVISFAAKWYGEKPIHFHSDHHDGHEAMIDSIYGMVDTADMVIGYNHVGFDMKHLNREFVLAGKLPPSPYKNIDLLSVVRKQFRFASNKLDHVAQELGLGSKTSHAGHELWVKCMAGDDKAWSMMRKYNKQDVALTEALYDRLKPWIANHPHMGLYTDGGRSCTRCGSKQLVPDGRVCAQNTMYQLYVCEECGGKVRGNEKLEQVRTKNA